MKVICFDGELEISEEILGEIPFFEPMLSGGSFEKECIEVAEDMETFRVVLKCLYDDFVFRSYYNNYVVYQSYCLYKCVEPELNFFISSDGKTYSYSREDLRNVMSPGYRGERLGQLHCPPFKGSDIEDALNWSRYNNYFKRKLSAEAASFLAWYSGITVQLDVTFICCEDEAVAVHLDGHRWRSKDNGCTVKCYSKDTFDLLKKYLDDDSCVRRTGDNWYGLYSFLSHKFYDFGKLRDQNFSEREKLMF